MSLSFIRVATEFFDVREVYMPSKDVSDGDLANENKWKTPDAMKKQHIAAKTG